MRTPRWLIAMVLALTPATASAHPGPGIVVDRLGRVFFVSTFQNVVMMIDTNGRARKFVTDPRLNLPHQLVLGHDGSLYVASDDDGRVWRIGQDGTLAEYFDTKTIRRNTGVNIGSWGDPFTVDAAGNIIALASSGDSSLVRVSRDGTVTPIALGVYFRRLHYGSLAWGADGALYVTDESRIWRIVGDSAVRIAYRRAPIVEAAGIVVDKAGNIYVADPGARRVQRIANDGSLNTPPAIARATFAGLTGVAIGPDGALYVLDNMGSGLQVWRVRGDRIERLFWRQDLATYAFGTMLSVVTLLISIVLWQRRSSGIIEWLAWVALVGIVVIGLYSLAGRFFIFSVARHPILLVYLIAVSRSYPKARVRTEQATA